MSKNKFVTIGNARILAGAIFLATLSGCLVGPPVSRGHLQTTVTFQDDYDYYPGYETYYSRNRHEYVYLEGNSWVRRPEPRGVSVNVFLASPSVRMNFRDGPEQHHRTVIRTYPRTWRHPQAIHAAPPAPHATAPEHRETRPEPASVHPAQHDEQRAQPANKKSKKDREKNRRDDAKDDRDDNKDNDRKDGRKDNR